MKPTGHYLGLELLLLVLVAVVVLHTWPDLLVAAAVVVFAVPVVYVAFWLVRNLLSPRKREIVPVVRRRMKEWDVSLVAPDTAMNLAWLVSMGRDGVNAAKRFIKAAGKEKTPEIQIAGGKDYYVTFLVGGREMEFSVPEDTYVVCDEGAEGLLVYQGERFLHFIPGVRV